MPCTPAREVHTMDLNKFTQKSQEAVSQAQNIAIRFGHQEVDAEHLLLSLVTQEQGLVGALLEKAGYDPAAYAKAVEQELGRRPKVSTPGGAPGNIYVSQRVNAVLLKALDLAGKMKDEYVSVEHVFLALLDEGTHT